MTIQNYQHAHYTALVLAITTEDPLLQKECEDMANSFSTHLTEEQIYCNQLRIESIIGGSKNEV